MSIIYSYHREIRSFVKESISQKFFWVGVHNREEDTVFRFLNGTTYDPSNKDEDHLYHWDEGFYRLMTLYILFFASNLKFLKVSIIFCLKLC